MDILDVANLINYFGKVVDVEDITVSPVLLQKGWEEKDDLPFEREREREHKMVEREGGVSSIPRYLQVGQTSSWLNLWSGSMSLLTYQ